MSKPMQILIVEDEMYSAMFLEMLLKEEGHEVFPPVGTGEEAIVSAEKFKPTLILMDIRLAGEIDGFEAAERIVAARPVAIIFMTGYGEEDVFDRAMKFKPRGFLLKPYSLIDIQNAIAKLEGNPVPEI